MTDGSLWLQAGHAWWVLHCDPETKSLERPFVVRFDHCTDVAVHDVSQPAAPLLESRHDHDQNMAPFEPRAWQAG